VHIITGPDRQVEASEVATKEFGITSVRICLLDEANYASILDSYGLSKGDFCLNLSVDVSSKALVSYCQSRECLYLDTVVEPWAGTYLNPSLSASERSNYAMREDILKLRAATPSSTDTSTSTSTGKPKSTALITHGANPGLVSHLLKRAMLIVAKQHGVDPPDVAASSTRAHEASEEEKANATHFDSELDSSIKSEKTTTMTQRQWATLAKQIGLQTVHIAERDTQVQAGSEPPRQQGQFINTWSVDGFVSEGLQPAELGWGTHEGQLPHDGHRHAFGSDSAIYLSRPGAATRVRTWTPNEGPFHGFLITHAEAISISNFLTLREEEGGEVTYRPTVHYAYSPCNDAILSLNELAGKNYALPKSKKVLMKEISEGIDELGVLLMGISPLDGKTPWTYWYGSQLSVADARELAGQHNSATSLQVVAAVVGGFLWCIQNPSQGLVEPEDVEHESILAFADPYFQPLVGVFSTWTPLEGRGSKFSSSGMALFQEEEIDEDNVFAFSNFRVS